MTASAAFPYGSFIVLDALWFGDAVAGYPSLVTIMFLGWGASHGDWVLGECIGQMFAATKGLPLYLLKGYSPISTRRDSTPKSDLADPEPRNPWHIPCYDRPIAHRVEANY